MPSVNDVYKALKDSGIDVYWQTKAPSPLLRQACVVSDSDDMPGFYTDVIGQRFISIDVCVPSSRYEEMDAFMKEVVAVMSGVNGLRYNGTGGSWPDDDMRASIRTVEYQVLRRYR